MTENKQSRVARRKQQAKKPKKKSPLFKRILKIVLLLGLLLMLAVGGLFIYYIATAPSLDPDKLADSYSSKLYDKDGELIADFGEEKRTKIEYDDLPQVLIDAVVATEDSRFFKHSGIDLRRIGGAIKANITQGFGSEGASTITQQLVERSFLTPDKKIKIKVQEQWLALKLEREYSKEEIMEMYLNKIFYGSGAYGVAKASEIYFGKTDLHDLTLVEAAMLAGLPQRPTAYNPYEYPELMEERVDTVLKLMVRHGKITEEEADEAREEDISSLLAGKRPASTEHEAFIQKVRKEVEEKVDVDIDTAGLKIYTTLDPEAQEHVEFLLTDSDENPIPYPDDEMQAGMAVLDTQTGAVRAIGGRRNSEGLGEYNYAFQGGQQPGSSFKPLISFAPAIEYNKWSTYHQINDDGPYDFGGAEPIRNWNRQYQGWMSMRYALAQSLNVPTLKILEETGLDKAKEFAEGLGVDFADDKIVIGDAIGGADTNTTPLELAGAFRAFGNEGIYTEPYTVTKIEYPDGEVVDLKPESEAAMSDYTAYMVTDMLKTVMSEGTGTEANIPNLHVAGKTGTTNLKGKQGSPDSWFTGYSTNYTISVWTGGYTDDDGNRDVMPNTKIPHQLFKQTMTKLSEGIETPDFVKPDSVVEVGVAKGSNPPMLPGPNTPSDQIVTELFVKGHEPGETSDEFDEIDPVSGLEASYNEDSNSIDVSWGYENSDDFEFTVSASIDGGSDNNLTTTSDHSYTISGVEQGSDYTITVVAISKDSNAKSEPSSVSVSTGEEEEDVPPVSGLSASYNEEAQAVDVSWSYDGPSATFEVVLNGESKVVSSNSVQFSGVSPGTHTVQVTPVTSDGTKGDTQSAEVTVPEQTSDEPEDDDEDNEQDDDDDSDVEANSEPEEEDD